MAVRVQGRIDITGVLGQRFADAEGQLSKLLSDQITTIRANTEAGRDINSRAFRGYSSQYRDKREKAGYRGSPPNLTITGGMLNAMQQSVKRQGSTITGEIGFLDTAQFPPRAFGRKAQSARDKARFNIGQGRKFFGLSTKARNAIVEAVRRTLKKGR